MDREDRIQFACSCLIILFQKNPVLVLDHLVASKPFERLQTLIEAMPAHQIPRECCHKHLLGRAKHFYTKANQECQGQN